MPTPREDRLTAVAAAVLRRHLQAAGDAAKARLVSDGGGDPDEAMEPGERKAVRVRDVDGAPVTVGHVRVDRGRRKATVVDEAAFTRWVEETAPGEIVTAVRAAYRDAVLKQARDDDEGRVVDPSTGELVAPPGVDVEEADPVVYVTPVRSAEGALGEAWRRGDLPVGDLPPGREVEG